MMEESEQPDCHYSRLHPKPLAFCTFGSRMISRGCYVFNRRLDHFRSVLNSMVERHLNSQMWRKIPPATDQQRTPLSVPPPAPSPLSIREREKRAWQQLDLIATLTRTRQKCAHEKSPGIK
ncbi:hypothetical protein scyTo_0014358 [Scyliorhinus torazame]|uniref:Uncharacterized protein n=1 Tax=Scyliorhinus torazame TaxID=75743 RepID=A0A401NLB2_SCYTO|nr:hypothetical protein [Scyliorhinus torazame]